MEEFSVDTCHKTGIELCVDPKISGNTSSSLAGALSLSLFASSPPNKKGWSTYLYHYLWTLLLTSSQTPSSCWHVCLHGLISCPNYYCAHRGRCISSFPISSSTCWLSAWLFFSLSISQSHTLVVCYFGVLCFINSGIWGISWWLCRLVCYLFAFEMDTKWIRL